MTSVPRQIPFSRPGLGAEETAAVGRVLESGWITTGPETAAFETEFREYTGAAHAMAVSSATAGLFMIMRALGVGPGDEVVVPSLTWPATANVVEMCGAKVVFCDVDYDTVCVRAEDIAFCLTDKTRAVMAVHFAGLSCELEAIEELLAEQNIPLVEDAAHAIGTRYQGEKIGKPHGIAACFSFHPIKNMTTGEGGMITTSDDEFFSKLQPEKFHGVRRDAWKRYSGKGLPHYDVEKPALKFNLPDILSAVGRVQLSRLDGFNARRRELAELYLEGLAGISGLDLPARAAESEDHSWHLFAVKVNADARMSREDFMLALGEKGVGTGLHFLAVHELACYRRVRPSLSLPVAERVGRRVMSLPLFPSMANEDVEIVCSVIRDVLRSKADEEV